MVTVILNEPEVPGNFGAICRVMKNFGFLDLVVVNPKFDINCSEAKIRSKHAIDVLKKTKVFDNLEFLVKYSFLIGTTAITGNDYNIKRSPIFLRDFKKYLQKNNILNKKTAILFGSEGCGLSNEILDLCDFVLTIETDNLYETLNLSHSVGIILYELSDLKKNSKVELASRLEKDLLKKEMINLIDVLYCELESKKKVLKNITDKIFGKSIITKREAFGYMGFLKKINKNFKKN